MVAVFSWADVALPAVAKTSNKWAILSSNSSEWVCRHTAGSVSRSVVMSSFGIGRLVLSLGPSVVDEACPVPFVLPVLSLDMTGKHRYHLNIHRQTTVYPVDKIKGGKEANNSKREDTHNCPG